MFQFFRHLNLRYQKFKLRLTPQQNLFYGFFTYVLAGFILLSLPWTQKLEVGWLDNLFIATSAVSTTGLVTVSIFDSYNFFGQFVIMCLFQMGGIGYLTFTTFMLLSTTRKITHWHRKLLKSEFTLPVTIKIQDFLKSVVVFTLVMELIGTVLFFIAFYDDGMSFWETLWSSVFHSISAFCTAGFSLFNNGFSDYAGDGLINFVISFLAISGSLGFIVITDLLLWFKDRSHRLSFTSKIIFIGFAVLLTSGFTLLYFFEPRVIGLAGMERIYAAFFQTMSAMTTVGFNTIDFGAFATPLVLITVFLMYIGASPSGTAGGMKITTLTAVFAIMKSRLRGARQITFLGRRIPFERLYIATSSFIFYTTLIFLGTVLLTFTDDFDLDLILFEVSSALGTVGLSMGITGDLTDWGKSIIIGLMFIGRLGVLTFGLAIWSKTAGQNEVVVVEDDLAV